MFFHGLFPSPSRPKSSRNQPQSHKGLRTLTWCIAMILTVAVIASARGAPTASASSISPKLVASTNHFNGNTDCPFPTSEWVCQVTLSEATGSTGTLKWSASYTGGDNFYARIKPALGTLSPGQKVKVFLTIIEDGCPSGPNGTNGTFTFTGPANSSKVSFYCVVDPMVQVTPTKLHASKDCSFAKGKGWTCIVTLGSNQKQQHWISGNYSGVDVKFHPASGILSQGQTIKESIFIPSMSCPAQVDLYFLGMVGGNVVWSC